MLVLAEVKPLQSLTERQQTNPWGKLVSFQNQKVFLYLREYKTQSEAPQAGIARNPGDCCRGIPEQLQGMQLQSHHPARPLWPPEPGVGITPQLGLSEGPFSRWRCRGGCRTSVQRGMRRRDGQSSPGSSQQRMRSIAI